MFNHLAKLISRYPRWILLVWAVLVVGALPLAERVGSVLTAQPRDPAGNVGSRVSTLLATEFENEGETTVAVVVRGDGLNVGDAAFTEAYKDVIAEVKDLPGVSAVQDYRSSTLDLVAPDQSFAVTLLSLRDDEGQAYATGEQLRDLLSNNDTLTFDLAGGPATKQELERISERDARRAELFGLPLSLLILVVAFGAVVASGLPILVALASITCSFAALFLLGMWLEFAVFTQSIVTLLGLATGIDYALLIVNRFREELRRDPAQPRKAAETTVQTAGKAVAFSGVTVMVALAALLVPPLPFIRSIGVGTIVVMVMSVAVSVTALPAALSLLGRRVNWLQTTRREPGQRSRVYWANRARRVLRHPWLVAGGGLVLLILLSLPALRIQLADPGPKSLSAETEAGRTLEALQDLELGGLLRSFDVVIDFGEQGFYYPSSVRKLSQFERAAEALTGVEGSYSALSADTIPRLLLFQYYATQETALNSELGGLVRRTVSRDGRYALMSVFPDSSVGPDEGAVLRRELSALAGELGVNAQVGGTFVQQAEWTRILYRSFPLALGLVYLATLVLLGLAFRSILIPIKSIILNTLTVAAAFGVITLIFQYGVGARLFGVETLGFVDNSAPIFIFAIVFGLSMDYEVFLVARLYEAHRRGLSDRDAVVQALSATGGVISSAALVMLTVFSVFIFSEVVLIKTLGIGLWVAIFLDATLVRVALVPAVMTLAGRWNWWLPRPLERVAKRVDLGHD